MKLVKAEQGTICEVQTGKADGERCFAPAVYCDLDGPDDPTHGPSFFCKDHKPSSKEQR